MAILKGQRLRLGPGDMTNLSGESEIWCETSAPTPSDGKNGDLWIVSGTNAKLYQKVNGAWVDSANNYAPADQALNDNQVVAADVLTYSAAQYPFARILYTIKRGAGSSRHRVGQLLIAADSGSDTFAFSHQIEAELGLDVNVTLSITMSGGVVHIQYTSGLDGSAIDFKHVISGW